MSPDDDLNPPFLLTMASDNDDDPNPISCSLEQAMNNSPFSGLIERNSFHYVPHESLSSTHMTPKNPRICSSFEDDAASKADSQPFNVFHSPNGTKLWCPIVDLSLKPTEGMIFHKWDDVVSFYDVYAENAGFSVRRSTVKKVQGVITHKYLLCNCAGRPQSKRKFDSLDVNSLYVRQSIFKVTDCKACLKVKAVQGSSMFKVYSFIEPHNHVLVSSFNKDLMKKGRQLDFSSKQFIHNMSLNRIGPMVAHRIQVTLKGGHHNVRGTPDDYNNWSKQLKYFIGDRDSKLLVEKLQSRADHLTNFSFHFVLSNGELRSLFWADDISKLNYEAFGDVLAFDATYQTNRYNMIFVPFTGVDHHNRCVTFGAGLLCNETIESYKWLLECFLKVHGKQPLLVLTDQDPAMRQAVPMVFDKSRHRLCMWHIMKKLPAKISGDLLNNTDIRRSIHKLVWNLYIASSTFEAKWNELIEKYGLTDNDWLSDMYAIRELWVPAYFRNIQMCCLMKTTSRCESSNSSFKVNSNWANTLVQFLLCFDTAIDTQRYNQRQAEFKSNSTTSDFRTSLLIEKHAYNIYSQKKFLEVRKEIHKGLLLCYVTTIQDLDALKIYTVSHLDQRRDVVNDFQVMFDSVSDEVSCSCNGFTRIGYLCRHIFCVFRLRRIDEIPSKYIFRRWMKGVLPDTVYSLVNRYGVDASEQSVVRHELLDLFTQCIDRLRCEPEGLNNFATKVKELKKDIFENFTSDPDFNKTNDVFGSLVGTSSDVNVVCSNPKGVRTKGSGRQKRFIDSVEKVVENQKKTPRLCKTFLEYVIGHDSRNCSLKLGSTPP